MRRKSGRTLVPGPGHNKGYRSHSLRGCNETAVDSQSVVWGAVRTCAETDRGLLDRYDLQCAAPIQDVDAHPMLLPLEHEVGASRSDRQVVDAELVDERRQASMVEAQHSGWGIDLHPEARLQEHEHRAG